MHVDIVDLREFYARPLGRVARRQMANAIERLWPDAPGERVAGLGYCVPWLQRYREKSERVIALMPSRQGAVEWPRGEPSLTAMVQEDLLPLPDAALDRILLVHALEHSEDPLATLNEAWRVLAPGGKILVVTPNRRGLWARFEHTPFGAGRPFSRGQLARLLRDARFSPAHWSDALHFPPVQRQFAIGFYSRLESVGRRLWPAFAGVIMVEAGKQMYQGVPSAQRTRRSVLMPVLAPQGAKAGRSSGDRSSFVGVLRDDTLSNKGGKQ